MRTFVYPGTFDPFTNGHLDIARRAAKLCDRLIIAVLMNRQKSPVFTIEERCAMVRACLAHNESGTCSLEVQSHDGLLVDFMRECGAVAIVRGLRSESDFRFEAEIAAANRILLPTFESILLPCRADLAFTSSSIVREVAMLEGDISGMVPAEIEPLVKERLAARRGENNE